MLNNLKKKLGNLTAQSDFLRKETAERTEQLANFEENLTRVTEERVSATITTVRVHLTNGGNSSATLVVIVMRVHVR